METKRHFKGPQIDEIARLCHEVNRVYCESIGDTSQPPWENATDDIRESAVDGVLFHLENPDALASTSHDHWMDEKLKAGWIWGPKKNPAKKEHPCLVPYGDLPREQQLKDYLFKYVVHAYAYCYGLLEEDWNL